jgi:Ribbon-helix-helix protein, copG family
MPSETMTVSFRLPTDEYRELEQAARASEESISEFVRRAVAVRTGRGTPIRQPTNTSTNALYAESELRTENTVTSAAPRDIILEEYVQRS